MPAALVGLTSLLFIPLTQDFYETNKWYAVAAIALLCAAWWAIRAIATGRVVVTTGRAFWALAALTATGAVSLLASSTNKVEAALAPFGLVLFGSLAFLGLVANLWRSHSIKRDYVLIVQPIVVLGILALMQLAGLPSGLWPTVTWLTDPLWTPAGSSLALIGLILMSIPLLIDEAIHAHKDENQTHILFWTVELLVVIAAGAATLVTVAPKLISTTLPLWTGWQVMLEALKRFPATLVGVGAENFLSAFTLGKPVALNMTPLWNTRFLANASTGLHIGTTWGLMGLAAFAFLLLSLAPRSFKTGLDWSRIFGCLVLLFLPPSVALLVFCTILMLLSEEPGRIHEYRSSGLAAALAVLVSLAVLAKGYGLVRSYRAEHTFFRAYLTAQQVNGGETQRMGQKAIALNPYVSRYHEAYAQTNLILAAAIAQKATSGELTQEDQQVVTQLVSQAVREGKLTTQLSPTRVTSWETLARLYQNLIGLATNADTWAVASYQRALELDPTNPGLRMELGSIYLSQKNYDAAIAHFAVAVALKKDLPNAHYNLANAYREQGNIDAARQELLRTRDLLKEGTDDYEQVASDLADLESGPTPNPTPTPQLSPPIELP
jgi:tetratricopeptide (TPR) repeat protein